MKENPQNYDAWFDYLRLLESDGNTSVIRETYERAIANIPPMEVGHPWQNDALLLKISTMNFCLVL